MTNIQKETIRYLRGEGLGYKTIAGQLELSVDAVKGYCKRNGLNGVASENKSNLCRHCGKSIEQIMGCKPKKFCSADCRQTWWNTHAYIVGKKAYYEITCAHCKEPFSSYGNKSRKYCGRPCYVAARFGGKTS